MRRRSDEAEHPSLAPAVPHVQAEAHLASRLAPVKDQDVRRYAATGPSQLGTGAAMDYVENIAKRLYPAPSEVTTGAAPGADTVFCLAALERWPGAHHRVVVPRAPHNSELIELLMNEHPQVEIVLMPTVYANDDRQLRRRAYRARNERMLSYADELVAFLWRDSFYRSGEFMTVNIAEGSNVAVQRHLLP